MALTTHVNMNAFLPEKYCFYCDSDVCDINPVFDNQTVNNACHNGTTPHRRHVTTLTYSDENSRQQYFFGGVILNKALKQTAECQYVSLV